MSAPSREVPVIGAGIAGLTAARDLAVDGYDVAILEARERTGGRIWTSHELGLPAELGASRIHGFEDNPIARLARRHAIAIVRTDISSVTPARYRSMVLYDEDGRRLSSGETAEMSEMMADYLDFVAATQKEGQETSMLAVEETFAAARATTPITAAASRSSPEPISSTNGRAQLRGLPQSLRRQIGMPVENRVFAAGEATSQFFPSTVHGAFLSGVRAAYEIKLADAEADLIKDGQGGVDSYVWALL
jgi:monoamine oxidase